MLFDVKANLAEIRRAMKSEQGSEHNTQTHAIRATRAKQHDPISTNSTNSTPSVSENEYPSPAVKPLVMNILKPSPNDSSITPYDYTIMGRPKTWTGKIVSLDEWRNLSAWDRAGPNGRIWCGKCREWVDENTGSSDLACLKCLGG